jgi:hypothetical protein
VTDLVESKENCLETLQLCPYQKFVVYLIVNFSFDASLVAASLRVLRGMVQIGIELEPSLCRKVFVLLTSKLDLYEEASVDVLLCFP